jgi:hypothetical protein
MTSVMKATAIIVASLGCNTASANTISLDFEDGLLPWANGWTNFVGETGTSWTIVSGQATGQGGNKILRSVGADKYGWVFDLDGLIESGADWSFSANVRRVASVGFGMFNDIGLIKYGSDAQGMTIGTITDTLWHEFQIGYEALTNTYTASIDGFAVSPFTPIPGNNANIPSGTIEAISFGFGNIGVTKTVEWDNIEFTYSNPAPVPLPSSIAFLALGLGVLGFRKLA